MNSLVLAAIALAFLVVAGRTLGRFLAATLATSEADYSTAAAGPAEGAAGLLAWLPQSGLPLALAGATMLAQAPTGADFVWVVLGAVLVAAPYLATLGAPPTTGLPAMALFSTLVTAWALVLLAGLLVHHPAVASAYLLELACMEGFRRYPRNPVSLIGLAVALAAAVALARQFPLMLTGMASLRLGNHTWLITPAALLALPLAFEAYQPRTGQAFIQGVAGGQWLLLGLLIIGTLLLRSGPVTFAAGPHTPVAFWLLGGLPLLALPTTRPPQMRPAGRFTLALILGFVTVSVFLLAARDGQPGGSVAQLVARLPTLLVPRPSWLGTWTGATLALGLRALLVSQWSFQDRLPALQTRPALRRLPWLLTLVLAALLATHPATGWKWLGASNFLLLGWVLWQAGARLVVLRIAAATLVLLAAWGLTEAHGRPWATVTVLVVAAILAVLGRPWRDPEQA